MPDLAPDFIKDQHPIYKDRLSEWETNEKVFRGGRRVRELLQPFHWESNDQAHFDARKSMATFVTFPSRMAERFVGYLAGSAPVPGEGLDFGAMGAVRDLGSLRQPFTQAEMLFYDVDREGSAMTAWMNEQQKWSMVTGHRWLGVESPMASPDPVTGAARTLTKADEQLGFRPYWVSFSPLQVPNWYYDEGMLKALVLSIRRRMLAKDGAYSGKYTDLRLLYVAAGFEDLGERYAMGGFWFFDAEGLMVDARGVPVGSESEQHQGDLTATAGEIPYTPLFYGMDRDDFSVSGTTEITGAALAWMNLYSAGLNDAIEGGGRSLYILGTDPTSFDKTAKVKQSGGRLIPVPAVKDGDRTTVPTIYDTASVSASSAITEMLERTREAAAIIASDELVRGPDTSGEARAIEFQDVKAPKLSIMAYHREAAENALLRWTEMRFGHASPQSGTAWTKQFDVEDAVADWLEVFDAAFKAEVKSPTLQFLGISSMLKSKGLAPEKSVLNAIEAEIQEAHAQAMQGASDLASPGDAPQDEPQPEA